MMSIQKLIIGITLMAAAPVVKAEMFDTLYIGADIGRSKFINSCGGYTSCKDFDFSGRASVGMLVVNFTTAELGYYSSGQTTKKGSGLADAIDSVEWQFIGTRYFPVGDGRFNVFGRLGLVHWEASETNSSGHTNASGNSILFGAGGKYFITKNIAARVLLEAHNVGNSTTSWKGNVVFMGAGLTYQVNQ